MEGNFGFNINTVADRVADLFDNDGQNFTSRRHGSLMEVNDFEAVCVEFGALKERGRSVWNDETQAYEAYWEPDGDLIRYLFPDGSAIVVSNGCWDIEGDTPFSWSGLL